MRSKTSFLLILVLAISLVSCSSNRNDSKEVKGDNNYGDTTSTREGQR